jgi:hypothetical protein
MIMKPAVDEEPATLEVIERRFHSASPMAKSLTTTVAFMLELPMPINCSHGWFQDHTAGSAMAFNNSKASAACFPALFPSSGRSGPPVFECF